VQVSLIIIRMTGYFAYPFSWVIFIRSLSLIMKCGGGVVLFPLFLVLYVLA
jgi:hypothetical protein